MYVVMENIQDGEIGWKVGGVKPLPQVSELKGQLIQTVPTIYKI